jgi:hypothetical protein
MIHLHSSTSTSSGTATRSVTSVYSQSYDEVFCLNLKIFGGVALALRFLIPIWSFLVGVAWFQRRVVLAP